MLCKCSRPLILESCRDRLLRQREQLTVPNQAASSIYHEHESNPEEAPHIHLEDEDFFVPLRPEPRNLEPMFEEQEQGLFVSEEVDIDTGHERPPAGRLIEPGQVSAINPMFEASN